MINDFPRSDLAPSYTISQVLKGGWQLSEGHSQMIDEQQAIEDMRTFVETGITTFDCADIYTGVEELIGKFLKKYKSTIDSGELPAVQVHTKCVPDLDELPLFTKAKAEMIRSDDYEAQFPLELMHKDLHLAALTAYEYNQPLLSANLAKELYANAKRSGLGRKDFAAIYKFLSEQYS